MMRLAEVRHLTKVRRVHSVFRITFSAPTKSLYSVFIIILMKKLKFLKTYLFSCLPSYDLSLSIPFNRISEINLNMIIGLSLIMSISLSMFAS